jgi:lipopolysaccharide biosynthesis glycosyltransferase
MIHICFGLHDADERYSKFVGTTMVSIFENTDSPVAIHILHDTTLTDDNRDKFSRLTEKYNHHVEFHNVEELCPDEINFLHEKLADKIKTRFSSGAFYRLLVKKIFDLDKIIYLDSDIVVNLDINELWQQDLQDYPLAAVPEIEATSNHMIKDKFLLNNHIVKLDNYFCSGVMMFNLDKLDENFFYKGVQFLADNPACESVDQDILNAFFSENYSKLVQKFDAFISTERDWNLPLRKKIYHYAGMSTCTSLDFNDAYNRLFFENFAKTPWFDIEVLARFGKQFRNEHDVMLLRNQKLMKLCAEHNRAFFLHPDDVEKAKEIFGIQDDEPIIEIHDKESLKDLVLKMRDMGDRRVFFIFYHNWMLLRSFLVKCGFREYEDFVNGKTFLAREQGGDPPFEYNFIRNM